jgi:hypothetical protein
MSLCHHRGQRMFGCVVTGDGTAMTTVGCPGVGSARGLVMSTSNRNGYRVPGDGNFGRVVGGMVRDMIERIHISATIVPRGIEGKVIAEVLEDC